MWSCVILGDGPPRLVVQCHLWGLMGKTPELQAWIHFPPMLTGFVILGKLLNFSVKLASSYVT